MNRSLRRCLRDSVRLLFLLACATLAPALGAHGQTTVAPRAGREAPAQPLPVVLFVGTSLTAGYGLPSDDAFPGLVQQRIDAEGLRFLVVNAGVSGDTSAGGLRRIDWLLRLPIAVLLVELGANDMLRGLDVDALRANLEKILRRARAAYPETRTVVVGMRAAPNLGATYGEAFEAVFPTVARAEGAALIPFLLEGVAGDATLNQADGIHPTAEGHRRIAETVWRVLGPILREARDSP
jgi:acyl-CoA thioesterase-1